MRKFALLVGLIVFAGLPAQGQNDYPKVELFAGYSCANLEGTGDTFAAREPAHGWAVSISVNFHKYFGLIADFAGQYGDGDIPRGWPAIVPSPPPTRLPELNFSTYQFLFGPRFTARSERVTGFAHALFGAFHTKVSSFSADGITVRGKSELDSAMGFGGGLDVNAGKRLAIRVFQVDYIPVRWGRAFWLQNVRAQAGIVHKFGGGS